MTMEVDIQRVLMELVNSIEDRYCEHPSLYSGDAGIALFYGYMYKTFEEEVYQDKCIEVLEKCITQLEQVNVDATLGNGVAGVGWLIRHLNNLGIVSHDAGDFEVYDDVVSSSIGYDLSNKNYDLMYGLIGKAVYFFETSKLMSQKNDILSVITQHIQEFSEQTDDDVYWQDTLGKQSNKSTMLLYNYGLAHGIPSVISFLSKAILNGIGGEAVKTLLRKGVDSLLKRKRGNDFCAFYNTSLSDSPSRLAWCYGDIGVAISIWYAYRALKLPYLKEEAIAIALNSTKRRIESAYIQFDKSLGVIEAGLCHGTSGLGLMYWRLYKATNVQQFKDAADYWYNLTLQAFTTAPTGRIQFLKHNSDGEHANTWTEDFGFLSGSTGIGLSLLSRFSHNDLPWDELLLTDIC